MILEESPSILKKSLTSIKNINKRPLIYYNKKTLKRPLILCFMIDYNYSKVNVMVLEESALILKKSLTPIKNLSKRPLILV